MIFTYMEAGRLSIFDTQLNDSEVTWIQPRFDDNVIYPIFIGIHKSHF